MGGAQPPTPSIEQGPSGSASLQFSCYPVVGLLARLLHCTEHLTPRRRESHYRSLTKIPLKKGTEEGGKNQLLALNQNGMVQGNFTRTRGRHRYQECLEFDEHMSNMLWDVKSQVATKEHVTNLTNSSQDASTPIACLTLSKTSNTSIKDTTT